MRDINHQLITIKKLLESILSSDSTKLPKYMTATEVASTYGLSRKTILNRSNLDTMDSQFIPSVKLGNGRKKYFERAVISRLLQ